TPAATRTGRHPTAGRTRWCRSRSRDRAPGLADRGKLGSRIAKTAQGVLATCEASADLLVNQAKEARDGTRRRTTREALPPRLRRRVPLLPRTRVTTHRAPKRPAPAG